MEQYREAMGISDEKLPSVVEQWNKGHFFWETRLGEQSRCGNFSPELEHTATFLQEFPLVEWGREVTIGPGLRRNGKLC